MKRMIAAVVVVGALVVASAVPSQAKSNEGHRPSGGRPAVQTVHPGLQRRAVAPRPAAAPPHRAFEGHRGWYGHRGFYRPGPRVFVGVAPVIVGPAYTYSYSYGPAYSYDPGVMYQEPAYAAPAPFTYYYCQSAGAYYPDVPTCPEPWVPVPAQ